MTGFRLNRVDLADLRQPLVLAQALHGQLGKLTGAIPVEKIALALDIDAVEQAELDGFEGLLLTDRVRSRGRILVNSRRGAPAARFNIAHELGHFLLEHHKLDPVGGFKCSAADMRETRSGQQRSGQELEANEFAIALLAPDHATAPFLRAEPSLAVIEALRKHLDLSRGAAARCLVTRHQLPLAVIWSQGGTIQSMARSTAFPWIALAPGQKVSPASLTARELASGRTGTSGISEVPSGTWTSAAIPELFEQVRTGGEGRCLTLIWSGALEAKDDETF